MNGDDHRRAVRVLTALLATAVAVSIVHYTDNYFNYADYPRSSSIPNPSATLIGLAWFGFTALGVAGYVLFRRRASLASLVLLAAYSGSGLVGIGHYLVPGATGMPWWRQAHVCAAIACGVGVAAFALWRARRLRGRPVGVVG